VSFTVRHSVFEGTFTYGISFDSSEAQLCDSTNCDIAYPVTCDADTGFNKVCEKCLFGYTGLDCLEMLNMSACSDITLQTDSDLTTVASNVTIPAPYVIYQNANYSADMTGINGMDFAVGIHPQTVTVAVPVDMVGTELSCNFTITVEYTAPCPLYPCRNNGTCSLAGDECLCETGFEGALCEEDVDDCTTIPCFNNATCADVGTNAFTCTCASGYTGTLCDEDIDDCATSLCSSEGTNNCTDLGADSYECHCAEYYSGLLCETHTPAPCTFEPCFNNGTCTDLTGTDFECACVSGTTGIVCETDIDDCASSPCYAAGTSGCFDLGLNTYECKCAADYSGLHCEASTANTYTTGVTLPSGTDADEYAALLELAIQVQFPEIPVTVNLLSDDDVTTYEIVFWVNNEAVPAEAAVESALSDAELEGTLVYVRGSGTTVTSSAGLASATTALLCSALFAFIQSPLHS
jgi:hypothetical protein